MSEDQESNTPQAAADQAAEFLGVFNGQDFDLGGGQKWRLPNPHLIPPAMKKMSDGRLMTARIIPAQ